MSGSTLPDFASDTTVAKPASTSRGSFVGFRDDTHVGPSTVVTARVAHPLATPQPVMLQCRATSGDVVAIALTLAVMSCHGRLATRGGVNFLSVWRTVWRGDAFVSLR